MPKNISFIRVVYTFRSNVHNIHAIKIHLRHTYIYVLISRTENHKYLRVI